MQKYIKDERIYRAALLRIVIKMRQDDQRQFEEIYSEVEKELRLEPHSFRKFFNQNFQVVLTSTKSVTQQRKP